MSLVQQPEGDDVAVINGQSVAWSEYEPTLRRRLFDYTVSLGMDWNTEEARQELPSIQADALDETLDRALLRLLAAEAGIELSDQEKQEAVQDETQAILDSGTYGSWEDFLSSNGLTQEYFERLVLDLELVNLLSEAHAPERITEQAHVRHILVQDETTGQEVLDKLAEGTDWNSLAAEYSQDTANKDQGGDLGWFPRGVMVPEFDEASFTLPISSTSELVQTQFGYHILWIIDRGERPMDDSQWEFAKSQAFDEWFTAQRLEAEIEYLLDLGQSTGSSSP